MPALEHCEIDLTLWDFLPEYSEAPIIVTCDTENLRNRNEKQMHRHLHANACMKHMGISNLFTHCNTSLYRTVRRQT